MAKTVQKMVVYSSELPKEIQPFLGQIDEMLPVPEPRCTYSCLMCNVAYTKRDSYSRHKRRVHGIVSNGGRSRTTSITCVECEKVFARSSGLLRHIKTIHKNPETLDKHKKRKNAGKFNPCTTCGKGFSTNSNLVRHMKHAHADDPIIRAKFADRRAKNIENNCILTELSEENEIGSLSLEEKRKKLHKEYSGLLDGSSANEELVAMENNIHTLKFESSCNLQFNATTCDRLISQDNNSIHEKTFPPKFILIRRK